MTAALRLLPGLAALALACGPQGSSSTEATTGTSGTTTDTDPTGAPVPLCTADSGASGGALEWSRAGDELSGVMQWIAVTPAEQLILAGTTDPLAGRTDVLVEARDPGGALLWTDTYGGLQGLDDAPLGIAVDPAGFVHVLVYETVLAVIGETSFTGDARLVVLRYAPDGAHVWRWERERPPVEPLASYAPTGQIAIAGDAILVLERAFDEPSVLVALDRFGNLTSERPLTAPTGLRVEQTALAPDGAAFLAGNRESGNGQHPLWLGRFAPDGALTWSDEFGGLDDRPTALVAGPDGDLFFTWSTSLPDAFENRLRRYDAAGAAAWTELLPLTGFDTGVSAGQVRCDGVLLLTSTTVREKIPGDPFDVFRDLWVGAYAPDGAALWSYVHVFGGPDSWGEGRRITAAYDGDALVLGSFLDSDTGTSRPWLARIAG